MKFTVESTAVEGCLIITAGDRHNDERGTFRELYVDEVFKTLGVDMQVRQTNLSWTRAHVIRGLHFQRKDPQGKLVQCLTGVIDDVCLDTRPGSPTFGKHVKVMLTQGNGKMLWCPPGTAHGFETPFSDADVLYHCSSVYRPEHDDGIYCVQPGIKGLSWTSLDPIISKRDRGLQSWMDYVRSCG